MLSIFNPPDEDTLNPLDEEDVLNPPDEEIANPLLDPPDEDIFNPPDDEVLQSGKSIQVPNLVGQQPFIQHKAPHNE